MKKRKQTRVWNLGTGFYASVGVMMIGALLLGCFISLAILNPRISKTEEMESAAITCRNVSGVPHRSEGLFIDVHSEEGLSAVGRLGYLAQKEQGMLPFSMGVRWEITITYRLKNGKERTRRYRGNTSDGDMGKEIRAIPEAEEPINAASSV